MDLYPWLLVIHVASLFIFFVAHGAAASVAFRLRREREPERVRALLELSRVSVGAVMSAAFLLGLAAGIWLTFLGNFWGRGWVWASLAIFIGVAILMTPIASLPLARIRTAAGIGRPKDGVVPPGDDAELQRLLERWNPFPVAALGVTAIAVITWLMFFKPF